MPDSRKFKLAKFLKPQNRESLCSRKEFFRQIRESKCRKIRERLCSPKEFFRQIRESKCRKIRESLCSRKEFFRQIRESKMS